MPSFVSIHKVRWPKQHSIVQAHLITAHDVVAVDGYELYVAVREAQRAFIKRYGIQMARTMNPQYIGGANELLITLTYRSGSSGTITVLAYRRDYEVVIIPYLAEDNSTWVGSHGSVFTVRSNGIFG